jgi:hypothetical protein
MPVNLEMLDDNRIMCVTFVSPWRAAEMLAQFAASKQLYDAATKKIHLLIDMRQNRDLTEGALRARYAPALTHPMSGDIVVVGANTLIRAAGEAVFRIARFKRVAFVDDADEGLRLLRQRIAEEA